MQLEPPDLLRDELDVIEHRHRRRIGHGDGESASIALERQDIVLERQLAWNELGDAPIDLEFREVDGRHFVLASEHPGEVGFLDETELDQVVAYSSAVVSLLLESLIELILSDQPFSQKQIADPRRFSGRSCQGLGSLR